nr:hypothetical protein [Tanacetum cinerariifolium]
FYLNHGNYETKRYVLSLHKIDATLFPEDDLEELLTNKGERMHDYQLGIESYQLKINITDPTLIIPGIEELEPYTVIIDPFIDVLPIFFDATLNRVLKKVDKILLVARHGFKEPPLTEEHKELMRYIKEKIKECL